MGVREGGRRDGWVGGWMGRKEEKVIGRSP